MVNDHSMMTRSQTKLANQINKDTEKSINDDKNSSKKIKKSLLNSYLKHKKNIFKSKK